LHFHNPVNDCPASALAKVVCDNHSPVTFARQVVEAVTAVEFRKFPRELLIAGGGYFAFHGSSAAARNGPKLIAGEHAWRTTRLPTCRQSLRGGFPSEEAARSTAGEHSFNSG